MHVAENCSLQILQRLRSQRPRPGSPDLLACFVWSLGKVFRLLCHLMRSCSCQTTPSSFFLEDEESTTAEHCDISEASKPLPRRHPKDPRGLFLAAKIWSGQRFVDCQVRELQVSCCEQGTGP